MRPTGLILLCLLLAATLLATQTEKPKSISAGEAKERIGEVASVCGNVASARYVPFLRGAPTFLNLEKPYPDQVFTVVIWGTERDRFGKPEEKYRDLRICVTGKISSYQGVPQIVVRQPTQITLPGKT